MRHELVVDQNDARQRQPRVHLTTHLPGCDDHLEKREQLLNKLPLTFAKVSLSTVLNTLKICQHGNDSGANSHCPLQHVECRGPVIIILILHIGTVHVRDRRRELCARPLQLQYALSSFIDVSNRAQKT